MLALYKTRFAVAPTRSQTLSAVAEECLGFVEAWVETSFAKGGREAPGLVLTDGLDHTSTAPQLRRNSLESGAFFHSFLWRKPDDAANRIWSTTIDLVSDGEGLDFQLQLGVEAASFGLEVERPAAARPRLISTLLTHPNWECVAGSQRLAALPQQFMVARTEEFVAEQLFSPSRELPAVVVTAEESGRRFPVAPRRLAERLAGTAQVFTPRDRLAAVVLDRLLGPDLAIGPYSIRVFAPGLAPRRDVDSQWHYFGETILSRGLSEQEFCDYLFQRLAARGLTLFRESPLIGRYRELAAAERRAQVESARRRHEEDSAFYAEFTLTLESRIDDLAAENADLRRRADEAVQETAQLRADLEAALANVRELTRELGKGGLSLEETTRPAKEEPKLVSDVVRYAQTHYKNLVFTESAMDSAQDVPESFKAIDKVKDALENLELIALERREGAGAIGKSLYEAFKELGSEYKLLSDSTKNQWPDEYTFTYRGSKHLFEEHFTLGAFGANTCLSIHFSTKLRDDKIVVGYVGRHRRNTQT